MRVAYGDNYIQEVKSVHTNGYYIFINGTTYEMPNHEKGYELFEQLLTDGYIDLRNYDSH